MDLIPHSFAAIQQLPATTLPMLPEGTSQGVLVTCEMAHLAWLLDKIEGWFEDRDEVILIEHGTTVKAGSGFFLLEWEECGIDPLFLAILRDEPAVLDYAFYTREEEN